MPDKGRTDRGSSDAYEVLAHQQDYLAGEKAAFYSETEGRDEAEWGCR